MGGNFLTSLSRIEAARRGMSPAQFDMAQQMAQLESGMLANPEYGNYAARSKLLGPNLAVLDMLMHGGIGMPGGGGGGPVTPASALEGSPMAPGTGPGVPAGASPGEDLRALPPGARLAAMFQKMGFGTGAGYKALGIEYPPWAALGPRPQVLPYGTNYTGPYPSVVTPPRNAEAAIMASVGGGGPSGPRTLRRPSAGGVVPAGAPAPGAPSPAVASGEMPSSLDTALNRVAQLRLKSSPSQAQQAQNAETFSDLLDDAEKAMHDPAYADARKRLGGWETPAIKTPLGQVRSFPVPWTNSMYWQYAGGGGTMTDQEAELVNKLGILNARAVSGLSGTGAGRLKDSVKAFMTHVPDPAIDSERLINTKIKDLKHIYGKELARIPADGPINWGAVFPEAAAEDARNANQGVPGSRTLMRAPQASGPSPSTRGGGKTLSRAKTMSAADFMALGQQAPGQ